jgi:hypothetical protein
MDGFQKWWVGLALVLGLIPFGALANPAPALQFDSDVSQSLRQMVLQDLAFVTSIEGRDATSLHQEIFGPVEGATYGTWFHSRVYYFGVDRCGGSAAVACVKSSYPNKMFVTQNFIRSSVPQVGRVSTLFHEARHTEFDRGMWPHAKCPADFPHRSRYTGRRLANSTACDSNAYGSYASAAVLMGNVARFCKNCNEKTLQDAEVYGTDQRNRVIGGASSVIHQDLLEQ